jgi:hypothetical protein
MTETYVPTSGLGWIDFSDEDKSKVMKVIELLKEDGTVDELGVGVIRNSLSDAMFSGITTIQTRAKYFFIIPYILQSYILKKGKKPSAQKYLFDEETRIMNQLTWAQDDPTEKGIIGYTVSLENTHLPERKWKQVERKPSTIYWNGLRTFGFLNTQLSLFNLLKSIEKDDVSADVLDYLNSAEEKGDDEETKRNDSFYFNIPYQVGWDQNLSIDLTEEEASVLKHKIIDTQKEKLLSLVLKNEEWMKQFLDASTFEDMAQKPFVNQLDPTTQNIIDTAIKFWKIFIGAHTRYNVLLQEAHGTEDGKVFFEQEWSTWHEEMQSFDWTKFNRDLMWTITDSHSKVKPRTRKFINNWIDGVKLGQPIEYLDQLVETQEKNNKGKRAKLRSTNDGKYSHRVGFSDMQFRFGNAKRIILDIANGLALSDD